MAENKFDKKEIMRGHYGSARAIEIYVHEHAEFCKAIIAIRAFDELMMVMRGRGWRHALCFNVLNDKLLQKYIKALEGATKKFNILHKEIEDYQRLLVRRRIQVLKSPNGHHKINIKIKKEADNG